MQPWLSRSEPGAGRYQYGSHVVYHTGSTHPGTGVAGGAVKVNSAAADGALFNSSWLCEPPTCTNCPDAMSCSAMGCPRPMGAPSGTPGVLTTTRHCGTTAVLSPSFCQMTMVVPPTMVRDRGAPQLFA